MSQTNQLKNAVEMLREGRLVAFPTETVYGLGADATNSAAVRRIFEVKGRPATNPLICHVADLEVAKRYARVWPEEAEKLARRFWPGALTVVVPKREEIVGEVTAGLDTVGLRAPDHPLTLEMLREFGGAVAGPSANRSMRVSPTTAEHVKADLGDRVDLILDGGLCRFGIESTVLDLSGGRPAILRPGGVSKEQIESVIGEVEMRCTVRDANVPGTSPGQMERHYAPRLPAYRFTRDELESVKQWCAQPAAAPAIMFVGKTPVEMRNVLFYGLAETPADAAGYARVFYGILRELEGMGGSAILIEMPPDEPQWVAVRDRIVRATRALPE